MTFRDRKAGKSKRPVGIALEAARTVRAAPVAGRAQEV